MRFGAVGTVPQASRRDDPRLAHAGNYAEVAILDGDPVGAALGFFGEPLGEVLHSHIVGVLPASTGSGIGGTIKTECQRDW